MTLYLSGPITGVSDYLERFARGSNLLRSRGYLVTSTPETYGLRPGWVWRDYIGASLGLLCHTQGVALLPGWARSRGARLEALVAVLVGIPVRPVGRWR